MMDEDTIEYHNSEPDCEIIEADGRRQMVYATCKNTVFFTPCCFQSI